MASPTVSIEPLRQTRQSRPGRASYAWVAAACLLFAVLYLGSSAVHIYGANSAALAVAGAALLDIAWHNIGECVAIGVCIAVGLLFPGLRAKALRRVVQAVESLAVRRTAATVFVGVLPLMVRIALLPALGVPEPLVADEFGYLLLADTFASGRLANPTHPFWKSFEAIYVFQQPSYSSIYPIAPAIPMAIAKLLGMHPWIGVWFAAGAMCALICWMLQGWLPPKWAFLGGMLAVCRFTVFSPWMNSYWGGAVAAAGGALVLGALPRIMKRQRPRDALLFGLGLVILAQSRPFEGTVFSLPLVGMLGYWLVREQRVTFRTRVTHVVLPVAIVMTALVAGTLWYNARTTGNPFLPPYLWHQHLYGTPQPLLWQAPIKDAPGVHGYQDIADVFHWQLDAHQQGFSWSNEGGRLGLFWEFYLQPLLSVPLLLLPLVLRNRRLLVLFLSAVMLLVGNAMYSFFFPHYAGPICGLMVLLIVSGLRYLRQLRFRGRPVGATVFVGIMISIVVSTAATAVGGVFQPLYITATSTARGQALKQLNAIGGKHLVLVRYSPQHRFDFGVVFNDADIDHSPVIWARQGDAASNEALAKHYNDRNVWMFNPDELPITLVPFTDKPYLSALVAGAGHREDPRDGVSPGSVAILLGANFARNLEGTTSPGPLPRLPVRLLNVSPALGNVFSVCESDPACADDSADASPFPFESSGVSVQFGSARAPILAVSNLDGQESVTVQVPFEVPVGETTVTLRSGHQSATRKVTILPATPGVFQMRMADGGTRAVVLHADGSMVDLQHPAHPGETLRMFATGLGPMQPAVHTNQMGSSDSPAVPVYGLIVGFHAQAVTLISATPAAGMVGVEEVTFQIPANAPSGPDIPLSLAVVVDGKAVHSNKSSLPVQ